ncbi:hypothetical protein H0H81_001810, partial [Sphagnurus paluster]
MTIQHGRTYHIVNVKSDTALDLSGTDGHSILGWNKHNGDNQKWVLDNVNNQWTFKNVGTGRYLGVAGHPGDGTPLTAVDHSVGWDIWPDEVDSSVY